MVHLAVHENGHKPNTHYFHMHEDGTEHEHNGPVYHSHEGYGAVINLKNQEANSGRSLA